MKHTNSQSEQHFQAALGVRLNQTCYVLQRLEQRMILTGHRSDQIAAEMKKVRQKILDQLNRKT